MTVEARPDDDRRRGGTPGGTAVGDQGLADRAGQLGVAEQPVAAVGTVATRARARGHRRRRRPRRSGARSRPGPARRLAGRRDRPGVGRSAVSGRTPDQPQVGPAAARCAGGEHACGEARAGGPPALSRRSSSSCWAPGRWSGRTARRGRGGPSPRRPGRRASVAQVRRPSPRHGRRRLGRSRRARRVTGGGPRGPAQARAEWSRGRAGAAASRVIAARASRAAASWAWSRNPVGVLERLAGRGRPGQQVGHVADHVDAALLEPLRPRLAALGGPVVELRGQQRSASRPRRTKRVVGEHARGSARRSPGRAATARVEPLVEPAQDLGLGDCRARRWRGRCRAAPRRGRSRRHVQKRVPQQVGVGGDRVGVRDGDHVHAVGRQAAAPVGQHGGQVEGAGEPGLRRCGPS